MKYKINLSKPHPMGEMRFGRHTILSEVRTFDLNELEVKGIKTAGPLYWFTFDKVKRGRPPLIEKAGDGIHDKRASKATI